MDTSCETDVLVVGGGTAGVIAALQAARAGARTTIIERMGILGGTMTVWGVSAPGVFHSLERQVIAGIGWDLVARTVAMEGRELPDYAHPPAPRQFHTWINPHLYAALAEEDCLAAGVDIHYGELVTDVRDDGETWTVTSIGKNLRRTVTAREIIDCSGDADVVGMLGLPREMSDVRQPGTLTFRLTGYDASKLDGEAVQREYEAAIADGRLKCGDFCYTQAPFIQFLGNGGSNQQHIHGADSTTSATQTDANIAGRTSLLRLLRFVKSLPDCENATIAHACPDTAIRETWRIVAETNVTVEDFLSGRVFPDAIGYAYYFVDVHTRDGVDHEFLQPGVEPTVPMGCLIPKGSSRLLVAGRTAGSDRRANSALRVQPTCMVMAQAAGAAAALAVRQGVASRDVPVTDVRALLADHDAILPPLPEDR